MGRGGKTTAVNNKDMDVPLLDGQNGVEEAPLPMQRWMESEDIDFEFEDVALPPGLFDEEVLENEFQENAILRRRFANSDSDSVLTAVTLRDEMDPDTVIPLRKRGDRLRTLTVETALRMSLDEGTTTIVRMLLVSGLQWTLSAVICAFSLGFKFYMQEIGNVMIASLGAAFAVTYVLLTIDLGRRRTLHLVNVVHRIGAGLVLLLAPFFLVGLASAGCILFSHPSPISTIYATLEASILQALCLFIIAIRHDLVRRETSCNTSWLLCFAVSLIVGTMFYFLILKI